MLSEGQLLVKGHTQITHTGRKKYQKSGTANQADPFYLSAHCYQARLTGRFQSSARGSWTTSRHQAPPMSDAFSPPKSNPLQLDHELMNCNFQRRKDSGVRL